MTESYDFSIKKRIVVKIGSSLIVDQETGARQQWISNLASDIASFTSLGYEIIIVSSGAIALGVQEMSINDNTNKNNLTLPQKQAMSAIGQISLMNIYHHIFKKYSLNVAQILLTASDCDSVNRRNNFSNTISELLNKKIIPIINENDSISVDEIKIGDNDTLAAHIAKITNADLMILFSDIDGLYDDNPKINKSAKFIKKVTNIDDSIILMAGDSLSKVGTGGMITKIQSAKMLQNSKCDTIITSGIELNCLAKLINHQQKFTVFTNQ